MKKIQHGFTLIELLVAMAIVGILTGIALPQFAAYKKKAFDATALSDLRSIALAEEAQFIDEASYLSCANADCLALPGLTAISRGVSLTVTATADSFTASARHAQGTKTYVWDSLAGGLVP